MSNKDAMIEVVVERFVKLRLPRALDIKKNLERGEVLCDMDIQFLEEMMRDISHNQHLAEGNQELQNLVARAIHLNKQITEMALANQQKNTPLA